jgi:hypothetical protein
MKEPPIAAVFLGSAAILIVLLTLPTALLYLWKRVSERSQRSNVRGTSNAHTGIEASAAVRRVERPLREVIYDVDNYRRMSEPENVFIIGDEKDYSETEQRDEAENHVGSTIDMAMMDMKRQTIDESVTASISKAYFAGRSPVAENPYAAIWAGWSSTSSFHSHKGSDHAEAAPDSYHVPSDNPYGAPWVIPPRASAEFGPRSDSAWDHTQRRSSSIYFEEHPRGRSLVR